MLIFLSGLLRSPGYSLLESDRERMAKSPWASSDSPPMDLDYENPDINNALYPGQMYSSGTNINYGSQEFVANLGSFIDFLLNFCTHM